jgi:integrase
LPQHPEWKHGDAGKVLRMFLDHIGIKKDVVFHTLRACFATHLLSTGVESLKVMRMSGVDVRGVAEGLQVLPESRDLDKVIPLFR